MYYSSLKRRLDSLKSIYHEKRMRRVNSPHQLRIKTITAKISLT